MGKHAAPRKPLLRSQTVQRAAAVSTGTLVLCLGAAAPALAATSPSPSPTVAGVEDPIPVPKPVATVVEQVSDATGLPDPLTTDDGAKPHHHRGPATTKPHVTLGHAQQTQPTQDRHRKSPAAYTVSSYPVGGLRSMPGAAMTAVDGRAPNVASTAPTTRIVQSAGSQLLPGLPTMTADQDTARILLVALAMMLLGGLSSGHIKAAQQRVFGI
jgi:hypothetical protein